MDRYNEVTIRHKIIGNREFIEGATIRTCSLSERDAAILNGMQKDNGFKYVKVEEVKEPTKQEVRTALLAKANELGLEFKKNISNDDLQKLIDAI